MAVREAIVGVGDHTPAVQPQKEPNMNKGFDHQPGTERTLDKTEPRD